MKKQTPILLINLERCQRRLVESQERLTNLSLTLERIDAVDGAKLTDSELTQHYSPSLNKKSYHKPLNKGEIATYLSHRKAWQKIVDEQLPYAVILEDDFIICGDLVSAIGAIDEITLDWDYIKLAEHTRSREPIWQQSLPSNHQLLLYNKLPALTLAQVVSLSGAQKLLAFSQQFGRPIDVDLQHWWRADLNMFGLIPYMFKPNPLEESEIDKIGSRQIKTHRWAKITQQLTFYFKNKQANKKLLLNLPKE